MPLICVVCRDKLTLQGQNGQLQVTTSTECGHLFHENCLTENFEKRSVILLAQTGKQNSSKTCPQCQRVVDPSNNRQIFLTEIEDGDIEDRKLREENEQLQQDNFILKGRLRNLEMRIDAPSSTKNHTTSDMDGSFSSVRYYTDPTIIPMQTTDSGLLRIEDLVVWFGAEGDSHNGVVKWIGSINDEIYTGVEFDEPIGNDFPEVEGRRLFPAAPFRGRLVRTRELLLQRDFYGE